MSIQGGAIFEADKEDNLVSILIPTYNSIKFVKLTIDSCLNQKYKNLEILISDDCSTDGTFEYLSQFYGDDKRIKATKNRTNLGIAANFNKLIDEANGDFIKFLGHDDVILDNFVSDSLQELEQFDYRKYFYIAKESQPTTNRIEVILREKKSSILEKNELQNKLISFGNWIGGPSSIMIHKDVLGNMRFNTKYESAFDYEFYLRLGNKFGAIIGDAPMYTVGIHENQASRKYESGQFNKEIIKIMFKKDILLNYKSLNFLRSILRNLMEYLYVKMKSLFHTYFTRGI